MKSDICNSTITGKIILSDDYGGGPGRPRHIRFVETTTQLHGVHTAQRILLPEDLASVQAFRAWCFATGIVTFSGSESDLAELAAEIDRQAVNMPLKTLLLEINDFLEVCAARSVSGVPL